mgnify:CR=1 FL=1
MTAATTAAPGMPDMKLSVRQVFGIDSDLEVPAYSQTEAHVPDLDPDYRFDRDTTIAILAGFAHNRRVMISGYHSDLYAGLLLAPEWRSLSYQVKTRGGPRTEYLWMNYAANAAHWADHAGVDFTDRQRIKRKAARWQRMYRELPASERMAVLAAILDPEPV